MKRKEYSGLYWDEDRQRYFPLSSKPKPSVDQINEAASSVIKDLPRKREPGPSYLRGHSNDSTVRKLEELKSGQTTFARRSRITHDIICRSLVSTCHAIEGQLHIWPHGRQDITDFRIVNVEDSKHIVAGDGEGWLYSRAVQLDEPMSLFNVNETWEPEFHMATSVSAVSISGDRCIATSFGPECCIVVKNLSTQEMFIIRPGDRIVHDVWSADLRNRSLIIGMRKRALHMNNIEDSRHFDPLITHSDVLALHQTQDCVYTGCRNGSIKRFDLRVQDSVQDILAHRFQAKKAPINYIKTIGDWQMIVNSKFGHLEMFDLRFSRRPEPIMQFEGHLSTPLMKLGVTVDPSDNFIFACGSDACIRGWSLRTGLPLTSPAQDSPCLVICNKTAATLQVTYERGEMMLWASVERSMRAFNLGRGGYSASLT